MFFSIGKSKSSENIFSSAVQKRAQHPICRQKVLPEKISIQILLLFKLVQASKVDVMNDGIVQTMPLHRAERM